MSRRKSNAVAWKRVRQRMKQHKKQTLSQVNQHAEHEELGDGVCVCNSITLMRLFHLSSFCHLFRQQKWLQQQEVLVAAGISGNSPEPAFTCPSRS